MQRTQKEKAPATNRPAPSLPPKPMAYIALVIGVGSLTLIASAIKGHAWLLHHVPLFVAVVLGMAVAERFVINFTFRQESMSFSMAEVAMTIGLLTLPVGPFVLALGAGVAVGQIVRRRPLLKAGFNIGMYTIAAAAAITVFRLVEINQPLGLGRWAAAVLGMAVFHSLNQTLLAFVVALVEKQRVREVLKQGAPILAMMWAGNVTIGILAQYLASTNPASLWLLIMPFALSYLAYAAWIRSKAESQKMRELYSVGATLVSSLGDENGIRNFLQAAKEMFRAEGAQIVTFEGPGALQVLSDTGEVTSHQFSSLKAPEGDYHVALERYVAAQEWDSELHSALASEIGLSGALVLYGHRGAEGPASFPKQDAALLSTLSTEASIAIRNFALFQSISEERTKLSDIVEHTSDGIYQVSNDRRIMTWNPAMESITGFSGAEAVGQMCFNVLRARDKNGIDMCSKDCPIISAGIHKCSQEAQAQIMTKDGSVRWISYTHSPIIDASGEMSSDVIVVRDVTKQRAAQEAKDDFVSTVTHELRTPITPIKGFLLTLLRDDINVDAAERTKFYKMMLGQTERLERLIGDLLDASRLESGRLKVEPQIVETASLISHMVDNYKASHPDREFRFSTNRNTCLARADQARLEQVVGNLIQNAIRYSPASEPIDVMVREEGSQVVIAVRDRGPGISYDEQEMVFERFYRSGHHLTREQGGTGLGLYIARRLAEAMGGELSLSSRLGNGSTFYVKLALAGKPTHEPVTNPPV